MRHKIFNFILTGLFFTLPLYSQTSGLLTFDVRSEKLLPQSIWTFTPKYIIAAWITDNNNNFVRSLYVKANVRKQHLVAWNAASGGNVVDAVTGATYDSVGSPSTWTRSHHITWDGKNTSKVLVPDGTYKLWIEQTSANSASGTVQDGPVYSISFSKGSTTVHLTPGNQPYFTLMDLVWTPSAVPVTSVTLDKDTIVLDRNDSVTLVATVLPSNATDKTINWFSLNTSVAVVSATGIVKGIGGGTTKIVATSADGSVSDTCFVIVNGVSSSRGNLNSDFFDIYPNPASSVLTIRIYPLGSTSFIDVYTLAGIKVMSMESNSFSTTIPVNNLPEGMYLISVRNRNQSLCRTFQINR